MNPRVSLDTVSFWARLSSFGDRPALLAPTGDLTYADLAGRVTALAERLGTTRRLVVIEGGNTVGAVVAYLAALSGGHAGVLVPSAEAVASYDADVVIRQGEVEERREGSAHDLHPDLALLLSTSGSTGSPKLVRLSHRNLTANATAIASYLQIRPTDVAPTTLPLHYCYGLSILNSHLSVGAALLLTDESVTESSFWDDFRAAGCTTLAGVPYTFDLLDRIGFPELVLPSLRYLTQAGGRLDPSTVRRYAELGQQRGFDLFVMYGATEATARMAYLPPEMTLTCPDAIGVAVPGGAFRVDDGELVYRGDNVMLGYACSVADLARGRDLTELRTGDLARKRPDGLYEITGRKARFAKVFGLRIDLERLEQVLAADGFIVQCADGGDLVLVAMDVSAKPAPPDLRQCAASAAGLPATSVQVLALAAIPRLPSGKPDYSAIRSASDGSPGDPGEPSTNGCLTELFAEVLHRDVAPDDSFVSVGGDSLSYVEMSIRLEAALGTLPANWHTTAIKDLAATRTRRRWGRAVETNVLLRALAIVLIVGSHTDLFTLMGGAHVLLAVAGYNFARFMLADTPRATRVRRIVASTARIVVPSVLWLALVAPFASSVTWQNVVLLNGVSGTTDWSAPWRYWFIEAIVYTFVWMAALVSLPWFDRAERRWPFWLPVGLALAALLTRYSLVELRDGQEIYRAHVVLWIFLLGWATAKATTHWHRIAVSILVLATLPGFFDQLDRTAVVMVGMLALVWVPAVRIPTLLARPVGLLASASLYIYLTHWQLYPSIEAAGHHALAMAVSLATGILVWWAVGRFGEIRENRSWLNPRRYAARDPRTKPATRSRGHDQPAHVAA
ncbi:MAG TPA: AMP-binding protein [Nocardioidaceae bacterium]|nr:AMP-binding protein [Nocardioidaceae bacterium]